MLHDSTVIFNIAHWLASTVSPEGLASDGRALAACHSCSMRRRVPHIVSSLLLPCLVLAGNYSRMITLPSVAQVYVLLASPQMLLHLVHWLAGVHCMHPRDVHGSACVSHMQGCTRVHPVAAVQRYDRSSPYTSCATVVYVLLRGMTPRNSS